VRYSGRLAEELAKTEPNGAIWANQFDNVANRQAHIETTGPEIWDETGGKVDGFICAVGSGGTLAGVGMALQPKGVKIGLADPEGAALHSFYTTGKLESPGSSITEGHRAGADHREPGRLHPRFQLPHPGCRGAADHLRPSDG
jgi:cysteine synthase A